MSFTNCHGQQTMKEVSKSFQKDPWQICLEVFLKFQKDPWKTCLEVLKDVELIETYSW
jgi:hypothetical protein